MAVIYPFFKAVEVDKLDWSFAVAWLDQLWCLFRWSHANSTRITFLFVLITILHSNRNEGHNVSWRVMRLRRDVRRKEVKVTFKTTISQRRNSKSWSNLKRTRITRQESATQVIPSKRKPVVLFDQNSPVQQPILWCISVWKTKTHKESLSREGFT